MGAPAKIPGGAPVTFRPTQAPAVVGVSRATIYRWAEKGHVKLYKRAGMTFLRTDEVLNFIVGLGDQLGD